MSFYALGPRELLDYATLRAPTEIGNSDAMWASLVLAGKAHLRRTRSPSEREIYRKAALAAVDGAHIHGSMTDWEWISECIQIRVLYLLRRERDREWLEQEADDICEFFLNNVEFDLEAATRDFVTGADDISHERRIELHIISGILKDISRIIHYVPIGKRAKMSRWLAVRK